MYYPYIAIPLVAWLVSQLVKFAVHAFRGDIDLKKLYESGGMPSAHTALIVAVTTTIGVLEGGSSPLFGFALSISLIIVYDAAGVRRSSGLHAEAIRKLYKSGNEGDQLNLGMARGHTPGEILGGAAVGLLAGLLFTYDHSLAKLDFLLQFPQASHTKYFLGLFAVATVAPLFIRAVRARLGTLRNKLFVGAGVWILVVFLASHSSVPIFGWQISWLVGTIATWLLITYLFVKAPEQEKHKRKPMVPKRTKRGRKRRP